MDRKEQGRDFISPSLSPSIRGGVTEILDFVLQHFGFIFVFFLLFVNQECFRKPMHFLLEKYVCEPICLKRELFGNQGFAVYHCMHDIFHIYMIYMCIYEELFS